jgi:hypothetical protein
LKMYKGIIETEALSDKKILKKFKLVKSYKEIHPDENPSSWNVNVISADTDNIESLLKELSDSMENEWYSLIWNNDFVFVIFHNRIFKIKNKNPWDKTEFDETVNYALSQNINKKYFDNLRNSIENW